MRKDWIVPFVDFPKNYHSLKKEIDSAIGGCLKTGKFVLQDDVREFEENLANFVGTKYAVSCNCGTDALFLSLKALGIGVGDEVITVSHTFIASIEAIVNCGAKPILVDIGDDYEMDVDKLVGLINKRTKAIIPVHISGRTCEMDKIMALAERYSLKVVEDAAQAFGAQYGDKLAGSFGDTGCFSFYPAKLLGGCGDNGGITTNRKDIYDKLILLRDHYEEAPKMGVDWGYGYNSLMDNIQAAILNVKIGKVPEYIAKRRQYAKIYHKRLKDIPQVNLPPFDGEKRFDVFQDYVVLADDRDELALFLRTNRVEVLFRKDDNFAFPNHLRQGLDLDTFNLPMTTAFTKSALRLPIAPELEKEQIMLVVEGIKKFYNII